MKNTSAVLAILVSYSISANAQTTCKQRADNCSRLSRPGTRPGVQGRGGDTWLEGARQEIIHDRPAGADGFVGRFEQPCVTRSLSSW
jgi:hypothetical protein